LDSTTKLDLSQFIGTANYYQTNSMFAKGMHHTDGVQYFAENAGNGAYWFLDIVATEYFPLLKKEPFISITLIVGSNQDDNNAMIVVEDGDCELLAKKIIEYTDCPVGEYKFFLTDNVLMLTSEY